MALITDKTRESQETVHRAGGRARRSQRLRRRLSEFRGEGSVLPSSSLYLIPNLFTSASLFLSLFAIVKISEGALGSACWLILLAAVCDAIDGPVARLTRTTSNFGLQLDSLADMVAFGVTPAFLLYTNLRSLDEMLPTYAPKLALGASALFAICAAIRLARFNVQAETAEKRHFIGLPSPGAAGVVVSSYLFIEWLSQVPFAMEYVDGRILHRTSLVLTTAIALLMVSDIPFPKLRKMIVISRNPFRALVILLSIICLLIAFKDYFPFVLFASFLLYVGGTLVADLRRKMNKRSQAKALPAE